MKHVIYHYFPENGMYCGTTTSRQEKPLPPNSTRIEPPLCIGIQKPYWNSIEKRWLVKEKYKES